MLPEDHTCGFFQLYCLDIIGLSSALQKCSVNFELDDHTTSFENFSWWWVIMKRQPNQEVVTSYIHLGLLEGLGVHLLGLIFPHFQTQCSPYLRQNFGHGKICALPIMLNGFNKGFSLFISQSLCKNICKTIQYFYLVLGRPCASKKD